MQGRIDATPDGLWSVTYVDRSEIICEAFPGAANVIAAQIEREGGLVCEQHPWLVFEHERVDDERGCAGPGMTREQAIRDGLLREDGWPLCPICKEDELYSLAVEPTVETICGCYRCGWRIDRFCGKAVLICAAWPLMTGSLGKQLIGFNGWLG